VDKQLHVYSVGSTSDSRTTTVDPAGVALLLCAYLVPAAGFSLALALGQSSQPTARTVLLPRLEPFIVATPPAFTLLGVSLYPMRISDADAVAWRGLCGSSH
jgi:hypothetical protein